MIFKPELAQMVLEGRKTVTRRPVKQAPSGGLHGDLWLPCRYKPGRTYAIQPGRGKRAVGRIRVLDVRRMELGTPNAHGKLVDALREGFSSWEDFREYWTGLYGSYDPTQLVDRIEFERVEGDHG